MFCIDRCLNRKNHETLVGDPLKLLGVSIMFFKFYLNTKFNGNHLFKLGFHNKIDISFHEEYSNSDKSMDY